MRPIFVSTLILLLTGCTQNGPQPQQLNASPPPPPAKPYVMHLPGVSGISGIDYSLREGLKAAGFDGPIEIFDWTCHDPGIPALHNRARNEEQAQILADKLTRQYREHPD